MGIKKHNFFFPFAFNFIKNHYFCNRCIVYRHDDSSIETYQLTIKKNERIQFESAKCAHQISILPVLDKEALLHTRVCFSTLISYRRRTCLFSIYSFSCCNVNIDIDETSKCVHLRDVLVYLIDIVSFALMIIDNLKYVICSIANHS